MSDPTQIRVTGDDKDVFDIVLPDGRILARMLVFVDDGWADIDILPDSEWESHAIVFAKPDENQILGDIKPDVSIESSRVTVRRPGIVAVDFRRE